MASIAERCQGLLDSTQMQKQRTREGSEGGGPERDTNYMLHNTGDATGHEHAAQLKRFLYVCTCVRVPVCKCVRKGECVGV